MRIVHNVIIFLFGAILGYLLELFYRNVIHKEKINPGFLKGPYLPLYGFGTLILYYLCSIKTSIFVIMIIFFVVLTLLELITGLIFIKQFSVKLWDYSKYPLNYKGIICPLFSVYWTMLGVLFYYFVYPIISELSSFILLTPGLFFLTGSVFGIFVVDLFVSFNLIYKLKKIRKDTKKKAKMIKKKLVISFKEFKESTRFSIRN